MKKKIGDLTLREIEEYCSKYYKKHKRCENCPFDNSDYTCVASDIDFDLDREIEVEENE